MSLQRITYEELNGLLALGMPAGVLDLFEIYDEESFDVDAALDQDRFIFPGDDHEELTH